MTGVAKDLPSHGSKIVRAKSGTLVDTSGTVWRLSRGETINLAPLHKYLRPVQEALEEYTRHLIRARSPSYAKNQFYFIIKVLQVSEDVVAKEANDGVLLRSVFDVASERLQSSGITCFMNHLDAYRRWYGWCVDMGFDAFDSDVAFDLEQVRIGGNNTGDAVLSNDPDEGPLRDEEFTALTIRLRDAYERLERGDQEAPLDRFTLAVAWLFIALGSNPKALILLDEEDLQKEIGDDGTVMYWLRVPRIKKRDEKERDQYKLRKLTPEVGLLLEELIADNARKRSQSPVANNDHFARPILRRDTMRTDLLGSSFEQDAYRCDSAGLRLTLLRVVVSLGLKSHVTGRDLKLTPRRMRYTFATRLVQEGASPLELAEALDHTTTNYVMVYFDARSDAVRRLDKALALRLGPIAQAFLGVIVRQREEAERGGDPASLIFRVNSERRAREPIGNCGSFGFCGLYAPIACYTCSFFRPWLDGAHEQVLDDLLALRAHRIERNKDLRLIQIHDETILAIGDVIARCANMRASEMAGKT